MVVHAQKQPIPPRALAISLAALAIPVMVVFWLPDWTSNGLGMLIWLTALIPAFLLSYYRGLAGVTVALAGGMAVIAATQLSVVAFQIAEPNWSLLIAIVAVYLAISIGIAILSEVLRREGRDAEDMALVDRLTGLPNRRHMEIALAGEFAAAQRGQHLSVVLFDLDHLRLVYDRHGHPAGDRTLKDFAKILRANTRKQDLSARFGGEMFVSVMRDTEPDAAVVFAQRMLDQIRDWPFPWGSQTVSAGVAAYQNGMASYELLLSAADRALQQAKERGRDMVCVAPSSGDPAPGASARVSVPILSMSGTPGASDASGTPAPARSTAARVYIVDDDSAVRSVLKRVIAQGGYELWDTGDPLEAIRHFQAASPDERPDVILTDVIMAAMSGFKMIDEIAKIDADVMVIFMSGYVQSAISSTTSMRSTALFLEKPITRELLLAAIRQATESKLSPSAAELAGPGDPSARLRAVLDE
jgi:diguanylate cyclase (GGDEF)-like protein